MSGHTPGPWRVDGPLSTHNHPTRYWEAVAFSAIGVAATGHGQSAEEAMANARLIAAAPDLLAALKEIALGEGAFSRDKLTHATNCIEEMKRLALAAIAKAEGR